MLSGVFLHILNLFTLYQITVVSAKVYQIGVLFVYVMTFVSILGMKQLCSALIFEVVYLVSYRLLQRFDFNVDSINSVLKRD